MAFNGTANLQLASNQAPIGRPSWLSPGRSATEDPEGCVALFIEVVDVQHFAYDMADTQKSSSSGVRRSTRTRTTRDAIAQKSKPEELADAESSELSELSDEESSDFDEPAHRESLTALTLHY